MGSPFTESPMRTHRRRPLAEESAPSSEATEALEAALDSAPEAIPRKVSAEPLLDSDLLKELAEMDQSEFTSIMSEAIGSRSPSSTAVEPGERVRGVVVRRTRSDVFVNIGAKQEATIDPEECDAEVGGVVEAFVLSVGPMGLRLGTRLRGQQAREQLEGAMAAGLPVEGRVQERNGGGFVIDLAGVRAFCPASHIALRPGPDLDVYLGQTMSFRILEMSRREAVVSRRAIEEEEAAVLARDFWKTVRVGQALEGPVASVQSFGVFIDVGPVQGLVPRSKMDGEDPTVGEKMKVKVLAVDAMASKLTLEPAGGRRANKAAHPQHGSLGTFADLFNKAR